MMVLSSEQTLRVASLLIVAIFVSLSSGLTGNSVYDRTLASEQRKDSLRRHQQMRDLAFQHDQRRVILYSELRGDRSGSAIQDMLTAHAFAFMHNATYGGACPQKGHPHLKRHMNLLHGIGLDKVLPIACPPHMTSVTDMPEDVSVVVNNT